MTDTSKQLEASTEGTAAAVEDAKNPELASKKATDDAAEGEENAAAAAAEAAAAANDRFYRNLKILPPRQYHEHGGTKKGGAGAAFAAAETAMTVALPPIRSHEPVSSLRAAMGELTQYAHFTHYRFQLEDPTATATAANDSGDGGGTTVAAESGDTPTKGDAATTGSSAGANKTATSPSSGGSGGGGGGGGGGKGKKSKKKGKSSSASHQNGKNNNHSNGGGNNNDVVSIDNFPSVYLTGPTATIVYPHHLHPTPTEKERIARTLDDFGDLSMSSPYLVVGGDAGDKEDAAPSPLEDGCGLRVVLEQYDYAGVRDHVCRLNGLLDGGLAVPNCSKLADDEELAAAAAEAVDEKALAAEGGEGKKRESSDVDGNKDLGVVHEEKKEAEKASPHQSDDQQDKSQRKGVQDAKGDDEKASMTKKDELPTYPFSKAVGLDKTVMSDFSRYYNFSCGEDDDLDFTLKEQEILSMSEADLKKRQEQKSDVASSSAGTSVSSTSNPRDWSMEQYVRRMAEFDRMCHTGWKVEFSGFHPPPAHRRGLGDIAYLEIIPPRNPPSSSIPAIGGSDGGGRGSSGSDEDYNYLDEESRNMGGGRSGGDVIFVTATPRGYYINSCARMGGRGYRFDPSPSRVVDPCFSHNLLDCLLMHSKAFRICWARAMSAAKDRSEVSSALSASDTSLESIRRFALRSQLSGSGPPPPGVVQPTWTTLDSVIFRPSWVVPMKPTGEAAADADGSGNEFSPRHRDWEMNRMHSYSKTRCNEELQPSNATYAGMDLRAGTERDWNEELQSAREMPTGTLDERIERARVIHKVLTDFHGAALLGAKAIFDGQISPINPNEPMGPRTFVYFFNNIFYSRAVDANGPTEGLDDEEGAGDSKGPRKAAFTNEGAVDDASTFKIANGDRAARKSVIRDAACMAMLHKHDFIASESGSKLYTLANVIVDYMGTRLVCQSMVPGILSGEQCHTLLYGAVASNVPLKRDDDMHSLLEECIGKACMVASRPVPSVPRMEGEEKGPAPEPLEAEAGEQHPKTTTICGPVEVKGIRGSDQRPYVLDLTRLTPRDANWVPMSEGGTGNWEGQLDGGGGGSAYVPDCLDDEEWKMAFLRPELVTALTHKEMTEFVKKNDAKTDKGADSGSKEAATAASDATDDGESKDAAPKPDASADGSATATEEDASLSNVVKKLDSTAEAHMKTLRYNVNVFLPRVAVEDPDEDVAKQLKVDEERARNAAAHLWDTVLPTLTKEIRESSGHNIPADGESLTSTMHARGINCRYLGRLAQLAAAEEVRDAQLTKENAEGDKSKLLPRLSMPTCWLELLECEMVARAAKHVLDSYLSGDHVYGSGKERFQPPAVTIASFLSAIISTSEESAADTEQRLRDQRRPADGTSSGPAKGNGRAHGSGRKTKSSPSSYQALSPEQDNDMSLLMFLPRDGVDLGDACTELDRSRAEIWKDVESEIGRRFRYSLCLYNQSTKDSSERVQYIPLLRRICQRIGVRLVARIYDLGGKCHLSWGGRMSSYPVAPVDVLDIIPTVKYAAAEDLSAVTSTFGGPASAASLGVGASIGGPSLHVLLPDAKATLEAAQVYWSAGALGRALDLTHEAAALFQRVTDTPLHSSIAKCLDLTAVILFQAKQFDMAAANAQRSLGVAVQLGGFDCAESLQAHSTLAHVLTSSGDSVAAFKHYRAAAYLMELMSGTHHAELANVYHKLATLYYENGMGIGALRFYQEAQKKVSCDRMLDCMIAKGTAVVCAALGQLKAAVENERRAYGIYRLFLGDTHQLTANSGNTVKQFTKLAVEQGKSIVAEKKKRREEEAATAAANEIEEAEAEARKTEKKKKPSHKKKKK